MKLTALAPIFAILGLGPNGLGTTKKAGPGPGAGTQRRIACEAAHRKREAERTKNAAPAKVTRQQRRWAARKGGAA